MRYPLSICTLLAACAAICLVGCQEAGVPLVPVEGKVTYGGGDWPQPGILYFAVKEPAADMPRKPGTAVLNADGTFKAKTFVDGDGLVPGTYSVNIECWKEPPSMGPQASEGVSYVPEQHRSGATSGFLVEVPMDVKEPIKVEYDVPKS